MHNMHTSLLVLAKVQEYELVHDVSINAYKVQCSIVCMAS
jgi:hypothetical protein